MAIYDEIRAAFETKLANIPGIPDIAWENTQFSPTTGQPYIHPRLLPTVREPAVRGTNPQIYYQGLYRVECYVPSGQGPSAADTLANTIIDEFEATTDLTFNSTVVSIRYAEREQGMPDNAHFVVPVNISWYIYS